MKKLLVAIISVVFASAASADVYSTPPPSSISNAETTSTAQANGGQGGAGGNGTASASNAGNSQATNVSFNSPANTTSNTTINSASNNVNHSTDNITSNATIKSDNVSNATVNSTNKSIDNITSNATIKSDNNSTAVVKSDSNSNINSNGRQELHYSGSYKTVPNVYAPPVGVTAPCIVGISGGVSIIGFGVSGGSGKEDKECTNRENARMLNAFGETKGAVALLCQNGNVYKAMRDRCDLALAKEQPDTLALASVQPEVAAVTEDIKHTVKKNNQ